MQSPRSRRATKLLGAALFAPGPRLPGLDAALTAVRIALSWIFIYYGAGKLFGAFNGMGLHRTALYFSNTAHLHPGGLFAVLGGVIEFGGAIALAFGFCSRLAALALFGDQVVAMITVTWANGMNSLTDKAGYEFNVTLCVLALVVVLLGAGRLSVDYLIGRRLLSERAHAAGASYSSGSALRHAEDPAARRAASSVGSDDPG